MTQGVRLLPVQYAFFIHPTEPQYFGNYFYQVLRCTAFLLCKTTRAALCAGRHVTVITGLPYLGAL
jgi:hypothetical protein